MMTLAQLLEICKGKIGEYVPLSQQEFTDFLELAIRNNKGNLVDIEDVIRCRIRARALVHVHFPSKSVKIIDVKYFVTNGIVPQASFASLDNAIAALRKADEYFAEND